MAATLPGIRRENLVAVMNAGILSWNTMNLPWRTTEYATVFQASDWLYSSRHGIKRGIFFALGRLGRNCFINFVPRAS